MSKVLVLFLRGLPLAHIGCYGNDWIETPTLDRLAVEGVVFDQHFVTVPDGNVAWRSGRFQLPAPTTEPAAEKEDSPDLLKSLAAAGVPALLVHDESRTCADEFLNGWQDVRRIPAQASEGTALERSLDAIVELLEKLAGQEHWLLGLSLATALPPWDVPESFRDRYFLREAPGEAEEKDPGEPGADEAPLKPLEPLTEPVLGPLDREDDELFLRLRYSSAAAVAYLDAGLELLCNYLREQNLLDGLTLIVMSDHGQPLGEHGVVGNVRPWLHEELVHLPLILRLPNKTRAGRRVSALTQTIDLMPTLLELLGVPCPPVQGHSFLPLIRGEVEEVRPYAVMGHRVGDDVEWALRTEEWAYRLPLQTLAGDPPRSPQLFVKPDDRWEVNDVRQHHLELAEHMEEVLRAFVEAVRKPGPAVYPELRDVETEPDAEQPALP